MMIMMAVGDSEQGRNYREVWGGVWHPSHPQSLRRRLYLYNFVGQILKIFECLELKSSCRKLFDKFTKILMKNFTEIKVHYFES